MFFTTYPSCFHFPAGSQAGKLPAAAGSRQLPRLQVLGFLGNCKIKVSQEFHTVSPELAARLACYTDNPFCWLFAARNSKSRHFETTKSQNILDQNYSLVMNKVSASKTAMQDCRTLNGRRLHSNRTAWKK